MSAILVERPIWPDSDGKPLAGGKVYFGTNGSDPVATAGATTIYSDRTLTTSIANPQTLNSNGRTASKVWIDGKYSIQVNSVVGIVETQVFQDLDAGVASSGDVLLFVSSVVGSNTITGSTDASISSYTANQQFVFKTAAINTTAVTLNVDGVGAKSIVKNNTEVIFPGDLQANQVVIVVYNATNDNFEWVNQNTGGPLSILEQAAADADTANYGQIWVKNNTPNELWFTDDAGTDFQLQDDPWASQPIGVPIPTVYTTTNVAIPRKDRDYRYVLLTAGEAGAGEYNEGIVDNEVVSGSSPTITATFDINYSGSILNNVSIRLLNTDGRFIRGGTTPNVKQDSANLLHGHPYLFSSENDFDGGTTGGWVNDTGGIVTYTAYTGTVSTLGSQRIGGDGGTESRSRNLSVNYYMRII